MSGYQQNHGTHFSSYSAFKKKLQENVFVFIVNYPAEEKNGQSKELFIVRGNSPNLEEETMVREGVKNIEGGAI